MDAANIILDSTNFILILVWLSATVYGVFFGAGARARRRWRQILESIAEKHKLFVSQSWNPTAMGLLPEGYRLNLRWRSGQNGHLSVSLEGDDLFLLRYLDFRPEPITVLRKANSDLQVGDQSFDEAVKMDLPNPLDGLGLLSPRIRQLLMECTSNGGSFSDGVLEFRSKGLYMQPLRSEQASRQISLDDVEALIETARELASLLTAAHRNPVENLLRTAEDDQQLSLRIQAVELLNRLANGGGKEGQHQEAAQDALKRLSRSKDPMVRVEVCGKIRDFATIRRDLANTSLPGEARAAAIALLPLNDIGQLRSTDRRMLVELARTETFVVLEAILKLFVQTDFTPDNELLKGCANRCGDKGRLSIVRLIGKTGAASHDWLITQLNPRFPLSSSAIVRILGTSTSSKAANAVQRVLQDSNFDPEVERAARAALAQLRVQLDHRSGALAVLESDGGQVSLVQGEGGSLSHPAANQKKQKA
jgi:hypothetical protein